MLLQLLVEFLKIDELLRCSCVSKLFATEIAKHARMALDVVVEDISLVCNKLPNVRIMTLNKKQLHLFPRWKYIQWNKAIFELKFLKYLDTWQTTSNQFIFHPSPSLRTLRVDVTWDDLCMFQSYKSNLEHLHLFCHSSLYEVNVEMTIYKVFQQMPKLRCLHLYWMTLTSYAHKIARMKWPFFCLHKRYTVDALASCLCCDH
jgi:hypothetical protein